MRTILEVLSKKAIFVEMRLECHFPSIKLFPVDKRQEITSCPTPSPSTYYPPPAARPTRTTPRPSLLTAAGRFDAGAVMRLNAMLLDVLAAVARKDYEDRRRRQAEGTAKAKAASIYKGRSENTARNEGIATMLRTGSS